MVEGLYSRRCFPAVFDPASYICFRPFLHFYTSAQINKFFYAISPRASYKSDRLQLSFAHQFPFGSVNREPMAAIFTSSSCIVFFIWLKVLDIRTTSSANLRCEDHSPSIRTPLLCQSSSLNTSCRLALNSSGDMQSSCRTSPLTSTDICPSWMKIVLTDLC